MRFWRRFFSKKMLDRSLIWDLGSILLLTANSTSIAEKRGRRRISNFHSTVIIFAYSYSNQMVNHFRKELSDRPAAVDNWKFKLSLLHSSFHSIAWMHDTFFSRHDQRLRTDLKGSRLLQQWHHHRTFPALSGWGWVVSLSQWNFQASASSEEGLAVMALDNLLYQVAISK